MLLQRARQELTISSLQFRVQQPELVFNVALPLLIQKGVDVWGRSAGNTASSHMNTHKPDSQASSCCPDTMGAVLKWLHREVVVQSSSAT